MSDIREISDRLKLFNKMYNILRVVDPVTKQVLRIDGQDHIEIEDLFCFSFWEQNRVCDNCISMRAYNENDCLFKIEYNPGKAYLITALPVELEGKRYVVELIKEGTNSIFIGSNESETQILTSIDFMRQSIVRDELTGLFNMRYVKEKMPNELVVSFAQNTPLSVLYIDFDGFKYVNDNYGHSAGDYLLKEFSYQLTEVLSHNLNAWAARCGGDEFIVCLPETDNALATKISETIRQRMETHAFVFEGHSMSLHFSYGIRTISAQDTDITTEQIIDAADKEMYRMKAAYKAKGTPYQNDRI